MRNDELLIILSAIFMGSGMTQGVATFFGWLFLAWAGWSIWRVK